RKQWMNETQAESPYGVLISGSKYLLGLDLTLAVSVRAKRDSRDRQLSSNEITVSIRRFRAFSQ
ncbi:MAG: hypothetical protein ACXV74_13980, partial [Methylobacter sp.]